ncbi:GNAT family N-acetyltransferase [Pontibacter sp. G13]|uniref:GNAT family N-acetyltransferase n=1 Tax=Pontibacter sp. G13 TaxID=3074898 RepID=UPI00288A88C3|nr:GNAT family N-acetyltransferase [Pontibacter sp. G13]WNJ16783.1 GNAT family N-acetyltransferase [Pontibacter sp. G13]
MGEIQIRKGTEQDMAAAHALVRELALFEKAPEEVETTAEVYAQDGFGDQSWFQLFVAEHETEGVVGIALFYLGYSTWKGKMLYLDDLVVSEQWRRKGIGSRLLDQLIRHAAEIGARQVRWQVLDWNESAMELYRKVGAKFETEWYDCKLNHEQIQAWASDKTHS